MLRLDRTEAAILRHLKALGSPLFDVAGLWPDERIQNRRWDRETVLKSADLLRAWNAQGAAIYVRPSAPLGVVLLDDVSRTMIQKMTESGFPAAAVVETSPDNYQVWLKLIENREQKPLDTRLISRAVRLLVDRFGADPGSADWRHFGRLGGFTNRKPEYRQKDGRFPYVLVHEATGVVAPAGRDHLIAARNELENASKTASTHPEDDNPALNGQKQQKGPLESYQRRKAGILARNQNKTWVHSPDQSRLDFMIACEMLQAGWSDSAVCEVLSGRPGLSEKHRIQDYVGRTVRAARKRLFPDPTDGEET